MICLFLVASPMFQTMFTTEMKESKENRVEINDFNAETVDLMLKWIYYRQLELKQEDFDKNLKLYKAAHKYCIDPLMDYLTLKIVEHHTRSEKALEIFEFGKLYENKAMIEISKEIIKR